MPKLPKPVPYEQAILPTYEQIEKLRLMIGHERLGNIEERKDIFEKDLEVVIKDLLIGALTYVPYAVHEFSMAHRVELANYSNLPENKFAKMKMK